LPLTRSDLLLSVDCQLFFASSFNIKQFYIIFVLAIGWQDYVVGVASKFFNCDSENAIVQKMAEIVRKIKFNSNFLTQIFYYYFFRASLKNLNLQAI
jgi:hypothetical protein